MVPCPAPGLSGNYWEGKGISEGFVVGLGIEFCFLLLTPCLATGLGIVENSFLVVKLSKDKL